MLALDKPYISSSMECGIETSEELCLEYGTATQLYLVPYVHHEEQVNNGYFCCIEFFHMGSMLTSLLIRCAFH